jgi:penicillin-insensitive murein endopeptidase
MHGPSLLAVGDLSDPTGGSVPHHGSHRAGRDVDLLFYLRDETGTPLTPTGMTRFTASNPTLGPLLDVARTWSLVRALISDSEVQVQWIFLSAELIDRLINHARAIGVPPHFVDTALLILHQPRDSRPHDDHMHVRIFCDPGDRKFGCVDTGIARWLKNSIRYDDAPPFQAYGLRAVSPFRFYGLSIPPI